MFSNRLFSCFSKQQLMLYPDNQVLYIIYNRNCENANFLSFFLCEKQADGRRIFGKICVAL